MTDNHGLPYSRVLVGCIMWWWFYQNTHPHLWTQSAVASWFLAFHSGWYPSWIASAQRTLCVCLWGCRPRATDISLCSPRSQESGQCECPGRLEAADSWCFGHSWLQGRWEVSDAARRFRRSALAQWCAVPCSLWVGHQGLPGTAPCIRSSVEGWHCCEHTHNN